MNTQEQFIEAAQTGNLEIITTYLSQAGADIECRGYLKQTALSRAINANNEVIVKFFLYAGADPNIAASGLPVSQMT